MIDPKIHSRHLDKLVLILPETTMVHGWFGWRFKAEVLWLILYKLYNKLYNINDIIKYSTTNVFFCFYSVPIRLIIILVVPFCSCGKRSWLKWQFCLLCRNLFFVILSYRMEFNLTWTYVQAFKVMFIVLNNPVFLNVWK